MRCWRGEGLKPGLGSQDVPPRWRCPCGQGPCHLRSPEYQFPHLPGGILAPHIAGVLTNVPPFGTQKLAASPDDQRNEVGAGYLVGWSCCPPLHFWMLLEGRAGLTRVTASPCSFRHCLAAPPPTRGSLSDRRCLGPTDRDPGEGAALRWL